MAGWATGIAPVTPLWPVRSSDPPGPRKSPPDGRRAPGEDPSSESEDAPGADDDGRPARIDEYAR